MATLTGTPVFTHAHAYSYPISKLFGSGTMYKSMQMQAKFDFRSADNSMDVGARLLNLYFSAQRSRQV